MNPAQHLLRFAVRLYRWVLSPAKTFVLGPQARCRFTPTCSEFALEAVDWHGAFWGGWFTVKRVCRCHPWGGFGFDPVPCAGEKVPMSSLQDSRVEASPMAVLTRH